MKKLGLISDPHAYPEPVAEALSIFKKEKVDAIWCTGDIAGYGDGLEETINLLKQSHCHSILGNHEEWYLNKNEVSETGSAFHYFKNLPRVKHEAIEGKSVYMVHASPPDSLTGGIRLLDQDSNIIESEKQQWLSALKDIDADVVIVGHTHQVFAEQLNSTLLINPGSTMFNHSCAILSLPGLEIQWFALSGEKIIKSWNWGMAVKKE